MCWALLQSPDRIPIPLKYPDSWSLKGFASSWSAPGIGNTLLALKKCGITEIVDGYGLMPYEENGIKFIPQLFHKIFPLPFGIQTFQIHLNYYNQNDFDNFKKFIELNSKKIITYDQAIAKLSNKFTSKMTRIIIKKILQIKRLYWRR